MTDCPEDRDDPAALLDDLPSDTMNLFDDIDDAPDNPEEVIAAAVLSDLDVRRAEILDMLRGRMKTLYRQRFLAQGFTLAYVTADDARIILDTTPGVPPPDRLNRNFMGSLFLVPGWKPTGQMVKSRTAGSHGNRLLCWRYQEAA